MEFLNNKLESLKQKPLLLYGLFWILIGFLCLPAYKAGFNGDFEGLLGYARHYNFWEFVNSKDFHVKSLYQITHFQLYVLIHLLGTHPIPWFLLLTGLHSLNAFLLFSFCKKIFADFKLPNASNIALASALLFLLSPNISEVTIWKGGYHYLPGVLFQLCILTWCRNFMMSGQRKYIVAALILFFISSYSLEIFYLTPWFCLILILAYKWKNIIDASVFKRSINWLFLGNILLFIAHLIVFRLRFGSWLAHYGTTGDFIFKGQELFPKLLKYSATLFLMSAHLPEKISQSIYHFCTLPAVYYGSYALVLIICLLIFSRFKKLSSPFQLASIFFGMMMLCIIILSPIFFDDLVQVYNSRRCYELSFPAYILAGLLLFSLFKSAKLSWSLLIGVLLVFGALAIRKAFHWRHAAKIQYGILNNYKWQNTDTVIILNMPTYFKDVRVIPVNDRKEFEENLLVFGHDTVKGMVYGVSSYNMNNIWDGAHVVMQDSMTLKVTLNQWGSWWIYNCLGANSYENELYRFELTDPGHEYLLHLKRKPKNLVILFQNGEHWHEVDLYKKAPEEQW